MLAVIRRAKLGYFVSQLGAAQAHAVAARHRTCRMPAEQTNLERDFLGTTAALSLVVFTHSVANPLLRFYTCQDSPLSCLMKMGFTRRLQLQVTLQMLCGTGCEEHLARQNGRMSHSGEATQSTATLGDSHEEALQ